MFSALLVFGLSLAPTAIPVELGGVPAVGAAAHSDRVDTRVVVRVPGTCSVRPVPGTGVGKVPGAFARAPVPGTAGRRARPLAAAQQVPDASPPAPSGTPS